MIEASGETVDLDGLKVRYLRAGTEGPPIVFLHGGGMDSASLSWRVVQPALASEFRTVAPDWPGYGGSDPPERTPTTDYYVEVLRRFVDRLGLDAFHLAGISMGGGVALGYALAALERVDRLALVDSLGLGGAVPGGRIAAWIASNRPMNRLVWAVMRRSRLLVRLALEATAVDPPPELLEEVYAEVERPGAGRAFQAFQQAEVGRTSLRTNYLDRLPDLAVPTLLIHGERDRLVPVEWAVRAGTLIPETEVRVLPRCGHWPPRERPERVTELLRDFFRA